LALLVGVAAFRDIAEPVLDRIEARSRLVDLRDGAQIFAQGDAADAADAVYAIIGGPGRVRIGAVGRDRKGLMVEILGTGDIFGEIGVMDGSIRTADAFADGNVRVLRISASLFIETLAEHAALGRNLGGMLAIRLRRTFALFQDATFQSLEVRLARQVLYLARRGGRRSEHGLRLAGRFRQGDLANLLGATTRSIITILNAWRASGVVAYDPSRAQLTLVNEAALNALVGARAAG
jgi:CRP/FNR family cyclic AMP-dependent transcriptional regulator